MSSEQKPHEKIKKYVITETQLKEFVDNLERYYGDHRVHTSCIHLSDRFDPPKEGFDEQIQFWVDGEIEIELSLKELKEKKQIKICVRCHCPMSDTPLNKAIKKRKNKNYCEECYKQITG